MTFNFSTLFIVFIGAIFRGAVVFSVVQLLWLNMIMDTLAAIALAAEKPRLEAIKDLPIQQHESIITKAMWRQIIGTTLYTSVVMFLMFWFNEDIWGITYNMTDAWMDGVDPSNKTRAFTMLFNIFVYMHLFNLINCREIKPTRRNVFKGLTNNIYFIVIFFSIALLQYLLVQWGGSIFRTAPLSGQQHAFCVLLGLTTLIPSFFFKFIDEKYDSFLTSRLKISDKEENEEKDDGWLLNTYNNMSKVESVGNKKKNALSNNKSGLFLEKNPSSNLIDKHDDEENKEA